MWRKITGAAAAITISFAGLAVTTSPANASSSSSISTVCTGFKDCAKKKVSTYGYSAKYKTSHWSMVGGHNCTNYVSYRLTNNGRVTVKKSGFNGARDWYNAAKKHRIPVTSKPKVGDIAWWKSGSKYTRSGHVAYVDHVYSNGTIRISEDNYKGDFKVRKISKTSAYRPNAFIRFPKSNGDAWGELGTVKKISNGISVTGFASDGDKYAGARVLLSFNGPRGTKGATQYVASARGGPFALNYTWRGTKPKTVHVYVLNASGTKGADKYVGTRATGY